MTARQCGACTLCCKLLPVVELEKVAGQRCQHQRQGKGCSIYPKRPLSCVHWSCAWLAGSDEGELALSRPDRSHYVIDIVPDYVTMRFDDAPAERIPVMQIWVDPAHPDAHRDPELRAWLDRQRIVALIRYGEVGGFVLFPPSTASDGEWHEERSRLNFNRPR